MLIDSKNNTHISGHFPAEPTEEMKLFAEEVCLENSKYIFYQKIKMLNGMQQGYCTNCKQDFYSEGMKHNKTFECPKCQAICIAKLKSYGRSKLIDKAYFVYFDKSRMDPNTVIAIGCYTERDYTGDYRKVETFYKPLALYVFSPGKAEMYCRSLWGGDHWKKRKTISGLHKTAMKYNDCFVSVESLKEAVKNTQFDTAHWERVELYYIFEAFDLYCRNYAFELLLKFGMVKVIEAKLRGYDTKPINWRGKNLNRILRVGKQDWKEIHKHALYYTSEDLRVLQHFRKKGFKCTVQEARQICESYRLHWYLNDLAFIDQFTSIRKVLNYVKKQNEKQSADSLGQTLRIFRDYINECIDFNIDITNKSNLFPKDLYVAHQRNIERKKAIADAKLNTKIHKRYQELLPMKFEYNGLFIRPARSAQELTYEGNKLNHCVANYSERYANGQTDLFVIRRKNKPNKPFYTVEIQKGELLQVRGYKNCPPTDEVRIFLQVFAKFNERIQIDTLQVS